MLLLGVLVNESMLGIPAEKVFLTVGGLLSSTMMLVETHLSTVMLLVLSFGKSMNCAR